MIHKDMHPARKLFRAFLLLALGISILFLSFMIGLRFYYKKNGISPYMQTRLFEADVMQYKFAAFWGNDDKDMKIAEQLIMRRFFSMTYFNAGVEMIEQKAEKGYQPAIDRLAKLEKPR